MKWYIVNTLSGGEKKAKEELENRLRTLDKDHAHLRDYFGEVLDPTETVIDKRKTSGRTKSVHRFFPSYILIQMELNEESYHLVMENTKIIAFVGKPDRRSAAANSVSTEELLASIPAMKESDVEEIKRKMSINVEKGGVDETLDLKCEVRVLDGPFVNFTGCVESIDREKQRVSVNVSILGRAVPVELDFSQVERVQH